MLSSNVADNSFNISRGRKARLKQRNGSIESSRGFSINTHADQAGINNAISFQSKSLRANLSRKKQPAFKGSFIKINPEFLPELKKALTGKTETKTAEELLNQVKKYVHKHNPVRTTLEHALKEGSLRGDSKIIVSEPAVKKFAKSFWDPAQYVIRTAMLFAGGNERRFVVKVRHKEDLQTQLIGLVQQSKVLRKKIDKVFSGEKAEQAIESIKKGDNKGFAKILKEHKVDKLLDISNGKEKGLLAEKPMLLKELSTAFLNGGKEQKTALEKLRYEYSNHMLKDKNLKKAGEYVAPFGGNEANLVARTVSGGIPAFFIANDFYNLKMLTTGDKKEAQNEKKSKFWQEAQRVGIYAFLGYALNSAFQNLVNKSLPFAVGLTAGTSVVSNIASRLSTGRQVLPINPDKLKNEPYIIHAASLSNSADLNKSGSAFEKLKNIKNKSSKVSFTGANFSEIVKTLDKKALKNLSVKMDIKEFEEGYKLLNKIDHEVAKKALKIAGKHMEHLGVSEKSTFDQIKKAALKNNGNVLVGQNFVYRKGRETLNILGSPFRFVHWIFNKSANLVRSLAGKDTIDFGKLNKEHPEQFIKNTFKWAKYAKHEANIKEPIEKASEESIAKLKAKYGENFARFVDTKNLEYSASDLSTFSKLTGLVSVPFLLTDAYNVTAKETQNKHMAHEKAKQRFIQDTTRQGISFWFVKSVNEISRGLMNSCLLGQAAAAAINTVMYETVTRVLCKQPIFPKTHEQMKEMEKKRLKNQGWLSKILGSKIKTHHDNKVVLGNQSLTSGNQALNNFGENLSSNSSKISELYKNKFEKNLQAAKNLI